jgi:hypothetical protein
VVVVVVMMVIIVVMMVMVIIVVMMVMMIFVVMMVIVSEFHVWVFRFRSSSGTPTDSVSGFVLRPGSCALGSEQVRWWPVSSARGTLTYDVWGNTANISQRLQEACEPGRINISGSTFHHRHTIRD